MAAPAVTQSKHLPDELSLPMRKRFKTSELPLNSAQRSSIDGLLHTIKKKGEYDILRKQVWSQFTESEEKSAFTKTLHELAEAEIDRDPSLLSRDRGKAATLMQGAVDRSDIYKIVEKNLDDLIAKNIDQIIKAGREIRRAEVGEEVAAEEQKRGSKTDEEYDQEIAAKRKERIRIRKYEEARKRREDEKDALRLEEQKKMKELEELRYQDEKRREREALRAQRDASRNKPQAMAKDEEKEKENSREKYRTDEQAAESPITPAPPVDEKALEEAALALLIQEGKEAAAKNAPKVERERSESPHRKSHISPPKGPAAMRSRDPNKPRLVFSSTPFHQASPVPPPLLSARSSGRSPNHVSSSNRDRSRSLSRTRRRSPWMREHGSRRESQPDAEASYRASFGARNDLDAESHRSDEDDNYEGGPSRFRERDATRDRDDRGKRNDYTYDYKYSREPYYRHDERSHSRDEDRDRDHDRYKDRRTSYTRLPREEAPEHIDRYVPGGARPRDKEKEAEGEKDRDRDRNRDKTRDGERSDHRDRDRDRGRDGYRDRDRDKYSHRDRSYDRDRYRHGDDREPRESRRDRDRGRDRNLYYDTDRERHFYKKETEGSRREYGDRDRDRGSHRDRDDYRERDKREERPYRRIRTDEPPEHIDRYVPGK